MPNQRKILWFDVLFQDCGNLILLHSKWKYPVWRQPLFFLLFAVWCLYWMEHFKNLCCGLRKKIYNKLKKKAITERQSWWDTNGNSENVFGLWGQFCVCLVFFKGVDLSSRNSFMLLMRVTLEWQRSLKCLWNLIAACNGETEKRDKEQTIQRRSEQCRTITLGFKRH